MLGNPEFRTIHDGPMGGGKFVLRLLELRPAESFDPSYSAIHDGTAEDQKRAAVLAVRAWYFQFGVTEGDRQALDARHHAENFTRFDDWNEGSPGHWATWHGLSSPEQRRPRGG